MLQNMAKRAPTKPEEAMMAITLHDYVVIERCQRDDDPDTIVNILVFEAKEAALEHVEAVLARSEERWAIWKEWLDRSDAARLRLFDEVVKPHLYKTEKEARERLADLLRKEVGPEPSRDEFIGLLEVFRCVPDTRAELIWSSDMLSGSPSAAKNPRER